MSEELFEKGAEPPKVEKKPKKQVSQATLDALARGREKMRAKREAEKKAKAEKKEEIKAIKENEKVDNKGAKENIKQAKTQRKKTEQLKKEQKALEMVQERERQAERLKKIQRFQDAKCRVLEKCASVKVYNELNTCLENIDEDTICDDEKLQSKILMMKESLELQDNHEIREDVKKHVGTL